MSFNLKDLVQETHSLREVDRKRIRIKAARSGSVLVDQTCRMDWRFSLCFRISQCSVEACLVRTPRKFARWVKGSKEPFYPPVSDWFRKVGSKPCSHWRTKELNPGWCCLLGEVNFLRPENRKRWRLALRPLAMHNQLTSYWAFLGDHSQVVGWQPLLPSWQFNTPRSSQHFADIRLDSDKHIVNSAVSCLLDGGPVFTKVENMWKPAWKDAPPLNTSKGGVCQCAKVRPDFVCQNEGWSCVCGCVLYSGNDGAFVASDLRSWTRRCWWARLWSGWTTRAERGSKRASSRWPGTPTSSRYAQLQKQCHLVRALCLQEQTRCVPRPPPKFCPVSCLHDHTRRLLGVCIQAHGAASTLEKLTETLPTTSQV